MGDMNIHITWLPHVRTGPQKKKIAAGLLTGKAMAAYASLNTESAVSYIQGRQESGAASLRCQRGGPPALISF